MIEVLQSTILGIASGLLYGLLWYARTLQLEGHDFTPEKFAGTLVVAAGVGAAFGLTGIQPGEDHIVAGIIANTAVIALLEPLLKSVFARYGLFPNYAGRDPL